MSALSQMIPNGPDSLSPGWLTEALRGVGLLPTNTVVGVETQVVGADRGFTGVVAQVRLVLDRPESGVPTTLIAKFPLAARDASTYRDAHQASAEQSQRYWERCAREVQFYRTIGSQIALSPRCYGAYAEHATDRMLILLEDLSAGEPGDAVDGCTITQAAVVVDALAAFHAHWWQHPMIPRLEWLSRWGSDPVARAAQYRRQMEPVMERYRERIPQRSRDIMCKLSNRYATVLHTLSQRPATLVHGDLHLDNLIFARIDDRPIVKLIDWQSVAHGAAMVDLGLFLVGSLTVADRRAAEFELLARYHQQLAAYGVTTYAFDELLSDYRLAMLWQLAGTVGWLARTDLATIEGRERELVEAIFSPGRVFSAVEDHAALLDVF